MLVAFLTLSLTAAATVAQIAKIAAVRARVSAAADLAALAAARAGDCDAAVRTARDNGADVARCDQVGSDVVVVATTDVIVLPGQVVAVSATARAGPP